MTDQATPPKLELSHTALSEDEALRILDGHRIRRGSRVMDPKAQIVGEFVKSVRVPGYFPPLPELRQQLRTMVTLMDELAPALPTMIVTAGFDPLRDEGHAYAEALRRAGVDVVYREYPGQIHAFVSLTKAIPQGLTCTLEVAEYLRKRLSA